VGPTPASAPRPEAQSIPLGKWRDVAWRREATAAPDDGTVAAVLLLDFTFLIAVHCMRFRKAARIRATFFLDLVYYFVYDMFCL
jgi:hypothetical protein